MEIKNEEINGTTVVRLKGKLTALEAPDLEKEVRRLTGEEGHGRLLIDMKDLEYISSAGLRVLLLGAKGMKARNGELLLCGLRENVKEVFDISGFTALFKIFPSESEALASVAS